MTQSPDPEKVARNRDPKVIHAAEQYYAIFTERLDHLIGFVRDRQADIYMRAGDNSDPSVIFDYMKTFIRQAEADGIEQVGIEEAHKITRCMAAAAITRLVCAPHTDTDPLAQLEKELKGNDDHN